MAKVSVVVPVYGVEQYIERCARSLFEQTLDDIEYLFINDCTPDNSIYILEKVLAEYPLRVPQTRIISMEQNSGQAKVRARGIKEATGDYIIHCDSDDWVDIDAYRLLYEHAITYNEDMVICDYYEVDGLNHKPFTCVKTVGKEQYLKHLIRRQIPPSTLIRLTRRSICQNAKIINPIYNYAEDFCLVVQYVVLCNKIGYINKPLYYYNYNPNSISHNLSREKGLYIWESESSNIEIAERFMAECGNPHKEDFDYRKMMVKASWCYLTEHPGILKEWRRYWPNLNVKVLFQSEISIGVKIMFYMTLFGLYKHYRKLKSI